MTEFSRFATISADGRCPLWRRGLSVSLLASVLLLTGCNGATAKIAPKLIEKATEVLSKSKPVTKRSFQQLNKSGVLVPAARLLHKQFKERYEDAWQRHETTGNRIAHYAPRMHPDDLAIIQSAHTADTKILADIDRVLTSTENDGLPEHSAENLTEVFDAMDEREAAIDKYFSQFG